MSTLLKASLEDLTNARNKMLFEMNEKHTAAEDAIHNYLSDQEDAELITGILRDGKTIKGAMEYCISNASKQKSNNAAMVPKEEVFGWVRKYFIKADAPKTEKVKAEVQVGEDLNPQTKEEVKRNAATPPETRIVYETGDEQLSLLDML